MEESRGSPKKHRRNDKWNSQHCQACFCFFLSEEDITEPSFSYRKRTERPLVKHKLKTSILGGIPIPGARRMFTTRTNNGSDDVQSWTQDQMASSKKNNSYKAYVQYGSITSMCWGIGMHVFLWGRKPEAVCEMGVAVKIPTLILK